MLIKCVIAYDSAVHVSFCEVLIHAFQTILTIAITPTLWYKLYITCIVEQTLGMTTCKSLSTKTRKLSQMHANTAFHYVII